MNNPNSIDQAPLAELISLLALERIEHNLFRAYHPQGRSGRLYGGQIMAQALQAAALTVPEDRPAHSLHGYFLRPGNPKMPALIEVERIRDGRSFTTRRVVVVQDGAAIFNLDASFQLVEPGLTHQAQMPQLNGEPMVPPDDARVPAELWTKPFVEWRVEHKALMLEQPHPPSQHIWFKAIGPLPQGTPQDALLHQALLVYQSDGALLSTARLPNRGSFKREDMQGASLDHAMWFHQPVVPDEWLLYALDSPSSFGARGYNRGSIFTTDGRLVASTMQEGLMPLRN